MSRSASSSRILALAALAVAAVMAIGVQSAAASWEKATFQPSFTQLRFQGAISVSAGVSSTTCSSATATGLASGSNWFVSNYTHKTGGFEFKVMQFECPGGKVMQLYLTPEPLEKLTAVWDTVTSGYRLVTNISQATPYFKSPWGNYSHSQYDVAFTNGSGKTPSTITFNKTKVGFVSGVGELTATGTLSVDNNAGTAVTLTH